MAFGVLPTLGPMSDAVMLEGITTRGTELEVLEEQLVKQLAEATGRGRGTGNDDPGRRGRGAGVVEVREVIFAQD